MADKGGVQTRSMGLSSSLLLDWSGREREEKKKDLETRVGWRCTFSSVFLLKDIVVLRTS